MVLRPLWPLVLALWAAPAFAQDAADAGAPSSLTQPPVLLKQVEAVFPADAADAGTGGTVVLEIDIGVDGRVTQAKVVQSAGPSFDEAALTAVRQFEFSPAEVDGVPSPVRILYSYEFLFRPEVAPVTPQSVLNFTGTVVESGTRNPLANATVVVELPQTPLETTTGEDGTFQLHDVPPGEWTIRVNAQDHVKFESAETFRPGKRVEVRYFIRRTVYGQYETVVRGARERKEVAEVNLKQEEIRLIPGTQGDALRVVQNLPGVARTPFGLGLLVVRGGKPWDTRVYVDETLIPLLFHFGGLYATFNSNLVEDISFQPGNFSAEYGRNIAGLVRARTKTPSKEGLHGYLDINLVDASALLEGPINKNWSISASARRSYIDLTLPAALRLFAPEAALTFTLSPRYYDYQVKVERREPGSRDRLQFSFFGSDDRISLVLPNPTFDPEGRGDFLSATGYTRLTVLWEKWLNPRTRYTSHGAVGLDTFNFGLGKDLYFRGNTYPVLSRQKLEVSSEDQKVSVSFGLDLLVLPFRYEGQTPPPFKLNQIPDPFVSRRLIREDTVNVLPEPGLFVEMVWKPLPGLRLVPGLRADYDMYMKDGWVDPRFTAFYALTDTWTVMGSVGLFHQPPDYRQAQLSPVFGNPNLLPEGATHYSVGVEKKFSDAISANVQVYYKSLFHQARATLAPAASDGASEQLDTNYNSRGVGRAAGVERLWRRQLTRRFFGWIAYSLSRAERYYDIDQRWGLHPFDQPHNLTAVASYKLPKDFIIGTRIRYSSGALTTPYVGAIYDANGNYYFPLLGQQNSRRLPPFFALDVRVDKRFVFNQWMLSLYLDVQNATNHGNVEGVSYNFDYSQEQYLYGLPIIPSLGIRGEF